MHKTACCIVFLLASFLLFLAATLTVEYYDGYEYIITGWSLWGDSTFFFPKNPVFSSLFTILQTPFHFFKARPSLEVCHLFIFLVHTFLLLVMCRWIYGILPQLSFVTVLAIALLNRLNVHYFSFALPDLIAEFSIGLWFFVDHAIPITSSRGLFLRTLVLSLCALGRLYSILIPVTCLMVSAFQTKKIKPGLVILLGGVFLYFLGICMFYFLGVSMSPHQAILGNIKFLFQYLAINQSDSAYHPWWVHFLNLYLLLTPIGVALVFLGSFLLVRGKLASLVKRNQLVGPLLGSGIFLIFLICMTSKDLRYTSPLFPILILLECFAIYWVYKQKAILGSITLVALFLSVMPEIMHYSQAFYRTPLQKQTAERIERFSQTVFLQGASFVLEKISTSTQSPIIFLKSMTSFFPPKNYFHWNDDAYYIYHWGIAGFLFYSKQPALLARSAVQFEQYGYPIPDRLHELIPPGVTTVIFHEKVFTTKDHPEKMPPVYAIRWFKRRPANVNCSSKVSNYCVEVGEVLTL